MYFNKYFSLLLFYVHHVYTIPEDIKQRLKSFNLDRSFLSAVSVTHDVFIPSVRAELSANQWWLESAYITKGTNKLLGAMGVFTILIIQWLQVYTYVKVIKLRALNTYLL